MSDLDDGTYKALVYALIVGIVFTASFNLYMRAKIMEGEVFSELYFVDHQGLPEVMLVNKTYVVSFNLANHEGEDVRYFYEVDSQAHTFTDSLLIPDGRSAWVNVMVEPRDKSWGVVWDIVSNTSHRLDADSGVASFNVAGVGRVIHLNVSSGGSYSDEYVRVGRNIVEANETTNASSSDKRINLIEYKMSRYDITETDGTYTAHVSAHTLKNVTVEKPFTVKVYRETDDKLDPLEIHFWHEIR